MFIYLLCIYCLGPGTGVNKSDYIASNNRNFGELFSDAVSS
jgi:hypothetical protein